MTSSNSSRSTARRSEESPSAFSRSQGAERHDEHAVVAAVGVGSHTDENHQEGGSRGVLGIYLSCESNQGLRRLIGHVRSQFDFHESVFAVTQANDGIDFQTVFIQEMVQRRQLTWLKENSTCFSFSLSALKDKFAKTAKNFSAIWPDIIHPFGQKVFGNLAESGSFSFLFVDSYFKNLSGENFLK